MSRLLAFSIGAVTMSLLSNQPLFAEDATAVTVASPNGAVEVTFELADGRPVYRVSFRGKPIIETSRMGFKLRTGPNLCDDFEIASSEESRVSDAALLASAGSRSNQGRARSS